MEFLDADVPLTNIHYDAVPLADIPDEDVPLTNIPDEAVPLADVPKTGDNSRIWMALALLSGAGLAGMFVKDKRREEEVK